MGQNIDCIFFERKKIFIFIEEKKDAAVHFIEVFFAKYSNNNCFE